MQHDFFFDGNSKEIAWVIITENNTIKQQREHAPEYLGKVSDLQSKYIALHVGLFWGIGRFIIKNKDSVTININDPKIFDHLSKNIEIKDGFIKTRTGFIFQFIKQRQLQIKFVLIETLENLASKIIHSKGV